MINQIFNAVCVYCSSPMPSKDKGGRTKKYCNRQCYYSWLRKGGNAHPSAKPKIKVICAFCDKEEYVALWRVKKHPRYFCSARCAYKQISIERTGKNGSKPVNKIYIICSFCGKNILRNPSAISKFNFCNIICKAKWQENNWIGINSFVWRGGTVGSYGPNWIRQRREALRRDKHQCQHCGKSKYESGKNPDVHHIIPFREFGYIRGENSNYKKANKLSNLTSLCPICHPAIECGRIVISQ